MIVVGFLWAVLPVQLCVAHYVCVWWGGGDKKVAEQSLYGVVSTYWHVAFKGPSHTGC
jgi:hypothetical protein